MRVQVPLPPLQNLHVRLHLAELLADALEPTHLSASHEISPLVIERFESLAIKLVQLVPVGVALLHQQPNTEPLVVGVNLGAVAQVKRTRPVRAAEMVVDSASLV